MRVFLHFLSLPRPLNMLLSGAAVMALQYFLNPLEFQFSKSLTAALVVAATLGGGNILNDLLDVVPDQRNHPHRFLARYPERRSQAWAYLVVLMACVAFLMLSSKQIQNTALVLLGSGIFFLLFLYNFWLKKIPLVGNFFVALMAASVVPFSILWLQGEGIGDKVRPTEVLAVYFLFIFLSHLTRELIKSIQDHPGDVFRQKHTLLSLAGLRLTQLLLSILLSILLALVLVLIARENHSLNPVGWLALGTSGYFFGRTLIKLNQLSETGGPVKLSRWLKSSMATGILSLVCWN